MGRGSALAASAGPGGGAAIPGIAGTSVTAAGAADCALVVAPGRNQIHPAASAANRQGIPEIAKLTGTPQLPATALTSKLPIGVVPMKTMVYTLMMRPRSSLGLESCTRVLA